jgi:hypothetical protein
MGGELVRASRHLMKTDKTPAEVVKGEVSALKTVCGLVCSEDREAGAGHT